MDGGEVIGAKSVLLGVRHQVVGSEYKQIVGVVFTLKLLSMPLLDIL